MDFFNKTRILVDMTLMMFYTKKKDWWKGIKLEIKDAQKNKCLIIIEIMKVRGK